jgi:hypothetical protein
MSVLSNLDFKALDEDVTPIWSEKQKQKANMKKDS